MQDELPASLTKRTPQWQVAMNWSLPIVLIAVFAWQIHKSWSAICNYHWELHGGVFTVALLLLLVNSLLEILIWNKTLGWFTHPLSFFKATPVYIWSSLARYIPGKVASLIARVALATEVDREVIPVLASSTVELALRIASGLLFLLVALFGSGIFNQTGQTLRAIHTANTARIAAYITIPLVLICAHPKIMMPVMNWALKKIKQQPITRSLRYRDVLSIFVTIVGRWVVYGSGFALLAYAIAPDIAAPYFFILICLAAGSWAIGFILLSPGGIGIAEFLQRLVLLKLGFPEPLPTIIPIAFRLSSLSAEGLWALVAIFMRRTWQADVPAPETEQVV